MEETMIYFGGEVKALDDNGRVGGYLVRFSEQPNPRKDLTGEYFTAKTYLGPSEGNGAEAIFDHGFPIAKGLEEFADRTFAPLKTKRDKVGIFAETVLNIADEYEKAVFGLVKKNKLGWSSGAPGHRVKKNADGEITHWLIAEGSLTPRPADPLNRAIPVKSIGSVKFVSLTDDDEDREDPPAAQLFVKSTGLAAKLTSHIEELIDGGMERQSIVKSIAGAALISTDEVEDILSGEVARPSDVRLKAFARVLELDFPTLQTLANKSATRTIKGMFDEALEDQTPSRWQLDSVYCDVLKKIANVAQASVLTGVDFDMEAKVKEATAEYLDRLQAHAIKQIKEYVESGSDEPFYLKAILNPSVDLLATVSVDLDDHSQLVESALKGLSKRYRVNCENRIKAGRPISDKNRTRIASNITKIRGVLDDMDALLEETQPMATSTEKNAALSEFMRSEYRLNQLGVME